MVTVEVHYKDDTYYIIGEFHPEERMVMYYADGSGYPGAPAELDVHRIECLTGELNEADRERITEIALEKILEEE